MYAIKACMVKNLDTTIKIGSSILSDSQLAIKPLSNHWITSKLVWDCHQSLVQMAEHNKAQLIWVPSHESTDRNEVADQLAKLGSE
jgi:ribonuclease HI